MPTEAEQIVDSIRARPADVRSIEGPPGSGTTDLLHNVAEKLGEEAILLHVPHGADQFEACLIDIGRQLGSDACARLDSGLSSGAEPAVLLSFLSAQLGRRPLLIDGFQKLLRVPPDEIGAAFSERATLLREWIERSARVLVVHGPPTSGLKASERLLARHGRHALPSWAGDVAVHFAWSARQCRLALCWAALRDDPADALRFVGDEDGFVEGIWSLLLPELRSMLLLLSTHERNLPKVLLPRLGVSDETLREGARLLLLDERGDEVWAREPWISWSRRRFGHLRQRHHQQLAEAFEAGVHAVGSGSPWNPFYALEAHRHFSLAQHPARARQSSCYGSGPLLELASRLLEEDQSAEAEIILEQLLDRGPQLMPQVRAYALHRLYQVRAARGATDPKSVTLLLDAARSWTDNTALWRDLVIEAFRRDAVDEALRTLAEAPAHLRPRVAAECMRVLVVEQRPLDAVRLWDELDPAESGAKFALEELAEALRRGVEARCLSRRGAPALVFHRPQRLELHRRGAEWVAYLPALDMTARRADPLGALCGAAERVRDETARLHGALTHTLTPEERLRKRVLLGSVDVVGSGIVRDSGFVWVLGTVVDDAHGIVFRAADQAGSTYTIDSAARLGLGSDAALRFARVRTDPGGTPSGPVDRIETVPSASADATWARWNSVRRQSRSA